MHDPNHSVSPPSQNYFTLDALIQSDPLLIDFFHKHAIQSSFQTAKQLMLDGIRYRIMNGQYHQNTHSNISIKEVEPKQPIKKQQIIQNVKEETNTGWIKDKQNNKHYNVAYIKHNRFLSPKQLKEKVTPKITQIIPAKSPPHFIYGKPKVKIDQGCGCPYHEPQCYNEYKQDPVLIKQIHIEQCEKNENNRLKQTRDEWQKELEKQTKEHQKKQIQEKSRVHNHRSPGMMRTIKSPKNLRQSNNSQQEYLSTKYIKSPNKKEETQSRIKELIDRDKKNKIMEKKLIAHERRLEDMEAKLKRVDKIPAQQQMGSRKQLSKEVIEYELSESSDSSGDFQSFGSDMLVKINDRQGANNAGGVRVVVNDDQSNFEFN